MRVIKWNRSDTAGFGHVGSCFGCPPLAKRLSVKNQNDWFEILLRPILGLPEVQQLIWIISCCNFASECSRQFSFSYVLYWPWCSLLETPTSYNQEKSFKTLRNVVLMCLIWDILSGYAHRDVAFYTFCNCCLNFSVLLWLMLNFCIAKYKRKTAFILFTPLYSLSCQHKLTVSWICLYVDLCFIL